MAMRLKGLFSEQAGVVRLGGLAVCIMTGGLIVSNWYSDPAQSAKTDLDTEQFSSAPSSDEITGSISTPATRRVIDAMPSDYTESSINQNNKSAISSLAQATNAPRVVAPELAPDWTKGITPMQRIERPGPKDDPDRQDAVNYSNAIVLGSDLLKVRYGKRFVKIKLSNVEGISFRQKCKKRDGESWACGGWARSRLSEKLKGKTIACKIEIKGDPSPTQIYPAKCWLGNTDLADIIIREGWGKAADSEYAYHTYLSKEALRHGKGIWQSF